jgi:hypothetical protein
VIWHYFHRGFYRKFDKSVSGALATKDAIPRDAYAWCYVDNDLVTYIYQPHIRGAKWDKIYFPASDHDVMATLINAPGLKDMSRLDILKAFYGVE